MTKGWSDAPFRIPLFGEGPFHHEREVQRKCGNLHAELQMVKGQGMKVHFRNESVLESKGWKLTNESDLDAKGNIERALSIESAETLNGPLSYYAILIQTTLFD